MKYIINLFYFYFIFKYIKSERILDSNCNEINSCYYCFLNENCVWCSNLNSCTNIKFKNNCNMSFIDELINKNNYKFLTEQYQCINKESDIEIYYNENKFYYSLKKKENENYEILYKIICFEYSKVIKININIELLNDKGILNLSYYNNLNDENKNLKNNKSDISIKEKTVNLCLKISYLFLEYENDSLTIKMEKTDYINFFQIIIIIGSCIISIFLILSLIILVYKKCGKNYNKISKNQKTRILGRKYNHLKQQSEMNSTGLNSINNNTLKVDEVNNERINKKIINENLLKKINLLPSFILDDNHSSFQLYDCRICGKKFSNKNNIIILSCNHFFHKSCLEKQIIINENNKCILCKSNII